jgi:sugar/nucleoside kinase (ribokinase family)
VLCAVGDLVEDIVVWLPGPPRPGTDTPARVFRRRGGSAANVAAFAAATGTKSRFIGRVGDDTAGHSLVAALRAEDVDVCVDHVGRTGTIVVLVEPDGERTMLPDRATATTLSHIADDWLLGVELIHLPAYSLTVEPLASAALDAAVRVRANGGRVSVDASSTSELQQFGTSRFHALLDQMRPDVLIANADEARLLYLDERPRPFGCVVVKDGPRAVRLMCDGNASEHVEVPAVTGVHDTTGAGDAFAAGFLCALLVGEEPVVAARAGVALAARTLTRPGATLEEVG